LSIVIFVNCHFCQLSFLSIVIFVNCHFCQLSFWSIDILVYCQIELLSFWRSAISHNCHKASCHYCNCLSATLDDAFNVILSNPGRSNYLINYFQSLNEKRLHIWRHNIHHNDTQLNNFEYKMSVALLALRAIIIVVSVVL
jgi:hypothetical protein